MCGYYAIAVAILMLVNYQMLKERTCQLLVENGREPFEIFQQFHMIALIICLILGYFHFTMVLHQFKLLFYSIALILLSCASMILYSAIAITWTPCLHSALTTNPSTTTTTPDNATDLGKKLQALTAGNDPMIMTMTTNGNIFSSKDTIGILVFTFDLLASLILVLSAKLHVCPKLRMPSK